MYFTWFSGCDNINVFYNVFWPCENQNHVFHKVLWPCESQNHVFNKVFWL